MCSKFWNLSDSEQEDDPPIRRPATTCGAILKENTTSEGEEELKEMPGLQNTQAAWDLLADKIEKEAADKKHQQQKKKLQCSKEATPPPPAAKTTTPTKKTVTTSILKRGNEKKAKVMSEEERKMKEIAQLEAQHDNLLNVLLLLWETKVTMSLLIQLMMAMGKVALRTGNVGLKRQVLTWREGIQEVVEMLAEKRDKLVQDLVSALQAVPVRNRILHDVHQRPALRSHDKDVLRRIRQTRFSGSVFRFDSKSTPLLA